MLAGMLAGKCCIALAVPKRPERFSDSFRSGYQLSDCFKQNTDCCNSIAGCPIMWHGCGWRSTLHFISYELQVHLNMENIFKSRYVKIYCHKRNFIRFPFYTLR